MILILSNSSDKSTGKSLENTRFQGFFDKYTEES